MLYRQYGWLCVWLLCRLYCSNAIVSLNCYTVFVPKYGRWNADVQVTSMGFVTGLALAKEPIFHNVFRRLTVNRSVPKIRSHFINKQTTSLLALFTSNLMLCIVAAQKVF